jgi:hypothetical protein
MPKKDVHDRRPVRFPRRLDGVAAGRSATQRGEREYAYPPEVLNRLRAAAAELYDGWPLFVRFVYMARFEGSPRWTQQEIADVARRSRSVVSDTEHRIIRDLRESLTD